jgi:hypothetical protein
MRRAGLENREKLKGENYGIEIVEKYRILKYFTPDINMMQQEIQIPVLWCWKERSEVWAGKETDRPGLNPRFGTPWQGWFADNDKSGLRNF